MTVVHARESTTPTDLMDTPGIPKGYLLADCACGAVYLVPAGEHEYELLDLAQLNHVLGEQGPVWLTRDQHEQFNDDMAEDQPDWCGMVESIPGRNIALTDSVEKSTPYLMGWLGRA